MVKLDPFGHKISQSGNIKFYLFKCDNYLQEVQCSISTLKSRCKAPKHMFPTLDNWLH